ncbi:MAG: hypothetical protein KDB80_08080 [Planctomycetes bacterium]|nr:hypothetical protein [Planctomycetota bacterium]
MDTNSHPLRSLLGTATLCVLAACGAGGSTGGGGIGANPNARGVPVDSVTLSFVVDNQENDDRRETVCVSIPFPEGQVPPGSLSSFAVQGHSTAWLPLQEWADGTVRVAQAQFTADLAAHTKRSFKVVRGGSTLGGGFQQHPWVQAKWNSLDIGARVHDRFGHRYESEISGGGETLQATQLKRVRRWRTYHASTTSGGIGRDFLASTFYVSEYRDMPFLVVDWIVGSDYKGTDAPGGSSDPNDYPLGPVDVNDVGFLSGGFAEVAAYRADWHEIEAAVDGGAGREFRRVMQSDWLADGQTKRYRFLLRVEDAGASGAERSAWQNRFDAFSAGPVWAVARHEAWGPCEAAGVLGGLLAGPSDAAYRAQGEWDDWVGRSHFGTWGSFGDEKFSEATGTPRNAPLGEEFAHAIQSEDVRMLTILEQKTWAQAQRPFHMYGLVVGAEQDLLLYDGVPLSLNNRWSRDLSGESLGRRALKNSDPFASYRTRIDDGGKPHGWNHFDFQHWTTDLQYEYYTMTGDEWAREELRNLGQCARGMARLSGFATADVSSARGEAWLMQSFVQVYLATRDESFKSYALRRAAEIVDRDRLKDHPSRALYTSGPDGRTGFPNVEYTWFAPWQMAYVMYGYTAAYIIFDSALCLRIAEDAVRSAIYCSVSNYTSPGGQFREWGLRYACVLTVNGQSVSPSYFDSDPSYSITFAAGTLSPMGSGVSAVARYTPSGEVAQMARQVATRVYPTLDDYARWDKWAYTSFER